MRLKAVEKIARDRTIETQGVELRLRAERRLGEMIEEARKAGELDEGGGNIPGKAGVRKTPAPPNLASQGVDKNLAKRARTLARISTGDLEDNVWTERLARAGHAEWFSNTMQRRIAVVTALDQPH